MIFTKTLSNHAERTRFLKFAVVGTIGAVVDFGVFNLLTGYTTSHPVLASVCSFTVAIMSNFTWNRYWTYPDSRSKSLGKQLSEFTMVNIVGVGIRTPVFAYLDKPLTELFAGLNIFPNHAWPTPQFLGHNMALAIAVVVVLFWNYFVNRYWTYNDVE